MDNAKKLIIEAIKELKKEECECDEYKTCKRCIAMCKLISVHNFLSDD